MEDLTLEEQYMLASELVRNTPEYKVAWELELWKQQEKKKFMNELKLKEKQQLEALEREVLEKENKKKQELEEQQSIIKNMEQQTKEKLENAKAKEQRLIEMETELRRRKEELESNYEMKVEEMNHLISMNKNETSHILNIKQKKIEDLGRDNEQLRKKVQDMDEQYQKLLREFHDFHLKISTSDTSQLINQLRLENNDLQRKLEQCMNAKKNYKALWQKLTREFSEFKNAYFMDLERNMKKERETFAEMKNVVMTAPNPQNQYIHQPFMWNQQTPGMIPPVWSYIVPQSAAPISRAASPRNEELKEIRELKEQITEVLEEASQKKKRKTSKSSPTNSPSNEEYQRLLIERDILMQTGSYKQNDDIIVQINKRLEALKPRS